MIDLDEPSEPDPGEIPVPAEGEPAEDPTATGSCRYIRRTTV
ncbi:hypothetical protein [Kitasatospora sp. NPDC088346]